MYGQEAAQAVFSTLRNARDVVGGTVSGANTPRVPRLHEAADRLEKLLAICHEHSSRLDHAANRLSGPIPEETQPGREAVASGTLEDRYAGLMLGLQYLTARLQHVAERFEASI